MRLPKSILITGASGFVGQHFCEALLEQGVKVAAIASVDCDLVDAEATLDYFSQHADADVILHLASYQAAGDFPAKHPGDQLLVNSRIHLNVLDAWRQVLPKAKLVAAGTSCAYPVLDGGLVEDRYMDGEIHGSVYSYAMSKRLLYTGIKAYNDQYQLNGSYLIPATMFGEYDDFHQSTAHVCGALINRFSRAARESIPEVEIWGDGTQVRDFMDVKEFVQTVLALLPTMNRAVLNIGPGEGASIKDLARMIQVACNYQGDLVFAPQKYSGVQSKYLDASRLQELYGLSVDPRLSQGLRRTARWFESNHEEYQSRVKFQTSQSKVSDSVCT